jgi:hypothetical protein
MDLLGRESELAVCQALLSSEQSPAGVVITGEAGIGKSAFSRAVVDLAVASGWRVLSTTGLRSEAAVPLTNLADLLDPVAHEILSQLPAAQAQTLRGALRREKTSTPADEAVVVRAAVNAIRAAAGNTQLVIAVDDGQWLDADTTRLLSTACAWLTDCQVVWLVAARGEQAGPGLAQVLLHELGPRCERLHLSGLSGPVLTQLVLDRFPGDWSPKLLRRTVELAAGNPYTVVELARETVAAGGRDVTAVLLPSSLTESLRARISRLPLAALAAAQVCALTPRPTRRVLRAVLDGQHVEEVVDDAVEAGILDAEPPGRALWFTHPLLREAVHDSLPGHRRRRLHRRLAAVIEDPVEVAGHLAAGAEEPDENLAVTVADGAEQAWHRGAPALAATLMESAITLRPDSDGPESWRLRILLLELLETAGEHERARRSVLAWLALGSTPGQESVPDDGVDVAVVSDSPDVSVGLTIDVTADSWDIMVASTVAEGAAYPPGAIAALMVSDGWHLRGVDSKYRQVLKHDFVAPWLLAPTTAQIIEIPLPATSDLSVLPANHFAHRTSYGARLFMPSIGRPGTSCKYALNSNCVKEQPFDGPLRVDGRAWYGLE